MRTFGLLLLLVVGCSQPPRPEHFSGVGFTDAELVAVRAACADWCKATDDQWCPKVDGGEHPIELVSSLAARHEGDAKSMARAAVDEDGQGHIWIVDRRQSDKWLSMLRDSVRHEMGHLAGCWRELPDGNTMGNYTGEVDVPISAADLDCVLNGG